MKIFKKILKFKRLDTANKSKNNNLKKEITFEENNNLVFTEFKKQKEEQNKIIKNLQETI